MKNKSIHVNGKVDFVCAPTRFDRSGIFSSRSQIDVCSTKTYVCRFLEHTAPERQRVDASCEHKGCRSEACMTEKCLCAKTMRKVSINPSKRCYQALLIRRKLASLGLINKGSTICADVK